MKENDEMIIPPAKDNVVLKNYKLPTEYQQSDTLMPDHGCELNTRPCAICDRRK